MPEATARRIPQRGIDPWPQRIFEAETNFVEQDAKRPNAAQRSGVPQPSQTERLGFETAGEWDRQAGIIVEWWCTGRFPSDDWDAMWMALIGETVRAGATPVVYLLDDNGEAPKGLLDRCAHLLETTEAVSRNDVIWITDVASDTFWVGISAPFSPGASKRSPRFKTPSISETVPSTTSCRPALGKPSTPPFALKPRPRRRQRPRQWDGDLYRQLGNTRRQHLTQSDIQARFARRLGCVDLVIVDALEDAATGHVDIWLAWADAQTLIVGAYKSDQDPINHRIIERNLEQKLQNLLDPQTGRPIAIRRMPMPSNCPTDAAQGTNRPAHKRVRKHLRPTGSGEPTSTSFRSTVPPSSPCTSRAFG